MPGFLAMPVKLKYHLSFNKSLLRFGVAGILSGLTIQSSANLLGVGIFLMVVTVFLIALNASKWGSGIPLINIFLPVGLIGLFAAITYIIRILI